MDKNSTRKFTETAKQFNIYFECKQVQNQLKRAWLNLLTKKLFFFKFIYKKTLKNHIIHVSTSSGEGYKNVAGIFPHILKIMG